MVKRPFSVASNVIIPTQRHKPLHNMATGTTKKLKSYESPAAASTENPEIPSAYTEAETAARRGEETRDELKQIIQYEILHNH